MASSLNPNIDMTAVSHKQAFNAINALDRLGRSQTTRQTP